MTDPRFRLTEQFMARCYAARTGAEESEAAEACAVFLSISQAMVPMLARALEAVEADAKILDLRGKSADGKPMTATIIAMRLKVHRATVFEAIRRHQKARRAALKMTA